MTVASRVLVGTVVTVAAIAAHRIGQDGAGYSLSRRQALLGDSGDVEFVGRIRMDEDALRPYGICVEWPSRAGSEDDMFRPEVLIGFYDSSGKTGTWRGFGGAGWLTDEYSYERGVLHGRHRRYHSRGMIAGEEHFREGIRHGRSETWFVNGEKCSEGTYVDGKKEGEWRIWNSTGQLDDELSGVYVGGSRVRGL